MKKFYILFIFALVISGCTQTPIDRAISKPTETFIPTDPLITISATPIRESTETPTPINTPDQAPASTNTHQNDEIIKVLFIGNSYTFYNALPDTFEKLMISGGYDSEVKQSTFGGWSLSNHAIASETLEMIAGNDWDFVILQEQSVVSNPEIGMYPAIRDLHAKIQQTDAETILFMTWGRRDGLPQAGYPNYEEMQTQVIENYETIGNELSLKVAPVGQVWQELHAENPELQLWDADGSHPSEEGTYLAANVFYAVLTGESPEGLPYLAKISEETAQKLQRAAAELILGSPQDSQTLQDESQSKIKGRIDVGSHHLFIHCVGTGTPTVILEAGWGDDSDTWSLIQPAVAESTRVCSYDRSGLGKSSPGPEPRTPLKEVDELHTLLLNAGVEGPYILVGHSWGGILSRLYIDDYPEDVVGLVLVDSSHPEMYQRNLADLPPESPDESESTKFYRGWFTNALDDPSIEVDAKLFEAGSLDDLPLVVLTVPTKKRADDFPVEISQKFDENWVELHQELGLLSSNSTHILVEDSSHFIQHDQPELLIEVILEMVAQLR